MRPALRFWLVVWGGVLLGSVLVWLTPPASATELHTTIPLQNAPLDIAVNAQTNRLYVVDGTARLSVVDTTRDRLHSSVLVDHWSRYWLIRVPIGSMQLDSHLTARQARPGSRLWMAQSSASLISSTWCDQAPIWPWTAGCGRLYVVARQHERQEVLDVYDMATRRLQTTLDFNTSLGHVVVNPQTNRVYVEASSESIIALDGASWRILATIPLNGYTSGLAVNTQTNRIYAALYESDHTAVIDGATHRITAVAPTGITPTDIVVNPSTNHVFIANGEMNVLTQIDGTDNRLIVDLPAPAGGELAVHPGANKVYKTYHDLDGTPGILVVADRAPVPIIGHTEGSGTIHDGDGAERAFRFVVERRSVHGPISGFFEYEWGPDQLFQRVEISSLVIWGNQAVFSDRTADGGSWAVAVTDASAAGQPDTLRVTISDGELEGGALVRGNIVVQAGAPTPTATVQMAATPTTDLLPATRRVFVPAVLSRE